MTSTRIAIVAAILLLACQKDEGERGSPAAKDERVGGKAPAVEEHIDEPAHEELPTRVRLPKDVVKSAGILTAKVTREVLPSTVSLPGEIAADPDKSAEISAPIAGRLEQVHFREGSLVKKGDVLAVIRVRDLGQLRSAHAATLAKAKAARANAERLRDLSAQRLASEQAYLDAVAQADALDVEARAAEEQLTALGVGEARSSPSTLALRAPLSGTVVMRDALVGQPVTAEHSIGRIIDLSEVWFLGRVFEKDMSKVRAGASAEVQLNAYPERRFDGRVEYVGRQVDPNARTVTARIRLTNSSDLLSVGLFGTAYVSLADAAPSTEKTSTADPGTKSGAAALVVPRTALTDVAGKSVVFVRHPDDDYELHEVVIGESAGGKVQIVSGLREGEEVVVEGAFTLKSAVLKSTFAEEQ